MMSYEELRARGTMGFLAQARFCEMLAADILEIAHVMPHPAVLKWVDRLHAQASQLRSVMVPPVADVLSCDYFRQTG